MKKHIVTFSQIVFLLILFPIIILVIISISFSSYLKLKWHRSWVLRSIITIIFIGCFIVFAAGVTREQDKCNKLASKQLSKKQYLIMQEQYNRQKPTPRMQFNESLYVFNKCIGS
jgi:membrane protein implicated in regulation of membrane protease activity